MLNALLLIIFFIGRTSHVCKAVNKQGKRCIRAFSVNMTVYDLEKLLGDFGPCNKHRTIHLTYAPLYHKINFGPLRVECLIKLALGWLCQNKTRDLAHNQSVTFRKGVPASTSNKPQTFDEIINRETSKYRYKEKKLKEKNSWFSSYHRFKSQSRVT